LGIRYCGVVIRFDPSMPIAQVRSRRRILRHPEAENLK
jgi:hypothetical protein